MKYAEKDVVASIRSQFTDENAKKFLNTYWRKKRLECGIPQTGFCYVSSHAYFRLMDGKNTVFRGARRYLFRGGS